MSTLRGRLRAFASDVHPLAEMARPYVERVAVLARGCAAAWLEIAHLKTDLDAAQAEKARLARECAELRVEVGELRAFLVKFTADADDSADVRRAEALPNAELIEDAAAMIVELARANGTARAEIERIKGKLASAQQNATALRQAITSAEGEMRSASLSLILRWMLALDEAIAT